MGQTISPRVSLPTQKGVFFERDAAGLSNVRLQMESMLAVCAAHGRYLALPPPSKIAHLTCGPFHEQRLWEMESLSAVVPIVYWQWETPPAACHTVESPLESTKLTSLPSSLHWYFPREPSRISHFECLKYGSQGASRRAVDAVLRSFELKSSHRDSARSVLSRLTLKPRGYAAVHLRRGDFRSFRPAGFLGPEALLSALAPLARDKSLLVVTDAEPGDPDLMRVKEALLPGRVYLSSEGFEASAPAGSLERAACDMLLCRWASDFVGTADSTFSLGIMGMRLRDALLTKEDIRTDAEFLTDQEPLRMCKVGPSWNKLTSFSV
jgi:hypothetical protein